MWLFVVVALVVAYLYQQYRRRCEHFRHFEKLGIPGPKPSVWFGNSLEIHRSNHLECQKKWHRDHGPVIGYFIGKNPVLAVADVDLLKQVEIKEFIDFADRPDWITGRGAGFHERALTTLKGQRWKEVRSTLTPSFTSSKLKGLNAEVSTVVDEFMENVEKHEGRDMEIYPYWQALTMDVICKTALGVNYNIQKDVPNHPVLKQAKALFEAPSSLSELVFSAFEILRPIARFLRSMSMKRKSQSNVSPIFALRAESARIVASRRAESSSTRTDLLQMMIDAQGSAASDLQSLTVAAVDDGASDAARCPMAAAGQGKKLSQEEVVDNAFLVLLAGYETTSNSLAFITRMLLRFPEVQERLREELMDATDHGQQFDFVRLQKCHFMEAVIQETLRMYPPIFGFTMREASCDKTLNGVRIPSGQAVLVSTRELHYREDYFPSPLEFQPKRFMPENRADLVANAWQPFGGGPRNCIGMRFAQMEMKIALAKLLTRYRLTSSAEPQGDAHIETTCVNIVTQRIRDPIMCTIEKL